MTTPLPLPYTVWRRSASDPAGSEERLRFVRELWRRRLSGAQRNVEVRRTGYHAGAAVCVIYLARHPLILPALCIESARPHDVLKIRLIVAVTFVLVACRLKPTGVAEPLHCAQPGGANARGCGCLAQVCESVQKERAPTPGTCGVIHCRAHVCVPTHPPLVTISLLLCHMSLTPCSSLNPAGIPHAGAAVTVRPCRCAAWRARLRGRQRGTGCDAGIRQAPVGHWRAT